MIPLETAAYGNPLINIGVFALFVAATLGVVIVVSRQKSKASDFYTGGAKFSGRQNGLSFVYLLAQMAGAGGLVALLLGVSDRSMQGVVIGLVGVLMIVYVLIGGMKGTTWVQMIKAVLLVTGAAVMTFLVLMGDGFNLDALALAAQQAALDPATGTGKDLLEPMGRYGASEFTMLSFLSLSLALIAGPSGLPHVLMRFYTVPTAREARRSAVWAIILVGIFFLFTLVLGLGAAKLVGQQAILAAPVAPTPRRPSWRSASAARSSWGSSPASRSRRSWPSWRG